MYRLTIAENARDPYGKAMEILGSYNPYTKELSAKKDRIEHWISKGAQMTPTVNNLLVEKKVITGDKVKASKIGKKANAEAAALKNAASVEKKEETKPETEKTEEKPVVEDKKE